MRLAAIWRHPVKAHGREALAETTLLPGAGLAWDRHWAVAHEAARIDRDAPAWVECVNFSRGAKAPQLMAIEAALDEAGRAVTLTHPDRPPLRFRPDDADDVRRFLDWVRPLCPPDRAQPAAIHSVPGRGLTDTDYPSVSIVNLGSNADLSRRMGLDLSPLRWRANLWLDGAEPWAEEAWPGRTLRIGAATLHITERIVRCAATTANPDSGRVDADTLGALRRSRGEAIFGVYARVTTGATIRPGDEAVLQ